MSPSSTYFALIGASSFLRGAPPTPRGSSLLQSPSSSLLSSCSPTHQLTSRVAQGERLLVSDLYFSTALQYHVAAEVTCRVVKSSIIWLIFYAITLFTCSFSRATILINNATGLGSPVKYLLQRGAHIISQNQPNSGSGTWPLWYQHQPQANPHQHTME